jgi:outer membrane lipoprotein-sorting protein
MPKLIERVLPGAALGSSNLAASRPVRSIRFLFGFAGRWVRLRRALVAIGMAIVALISSLDAHAADDAAVKGRLGGVAPQFIGQSCIATVVMDINKADWQRKITMQFWALGGTKFLIRILAPAEDAGTAILKVGDTTWYYLPKANRTVEMLPSMMLSSWMGSHFTLSDLISESTLTDDYTPATSFEGDRGGAPVSEYTLTPKPDAAVVWGKIVLQIRQADKMPVWQRFYDEDGKLVRELTFSDYKSIGGKLIPTHLDMQPIEQAPEHTSITFEKIEFDTPISPDIFALKNLKQ